MNKKVVFIGLIIAFPIALIFFFQFFSEPRFDIPLSYQTGVRPDTLVSNTWSAPSSAATVAMLCIKLSLRANTVCGAVVSSTETRNPVPSMVYSLESMRSNSASEKAETSDLAANISAA